MGNNFSKITKFTDMVVRQEGHKLVLMIYRTKDTFPKEKKYSLINQLRRAVVSITLCLAEGFTRRSLKEKLQLYKFSRLTGGNTKPAPCNTRRWISERGRLF